MDIVPMIAISVLFGFIAIILVASGMNQRGKVPPPEESSESKPAGAATVIRGGSDGPVHAWVKNPGGPMVPCFLLGGGQGNGKTRRVRFNGSRDAKVSAARIVY